MAGPVGNKNIAEAHNIISGLVRKDKSTDNKGREITYIPKTRVLVAGYQLTGVLKAAELIEKAIKENGSFSQQDINTLKDLQNKLHTLQIARLASKGILNVEDSAKVLEQKLESSDQHALSVHLCLKSVKKAINDFEKATPSPGTTQSPASTTPAIAENQIKQKTSAPAITQAQTKPTSEKALPKEDEVVANLPTWISFADKIETSKKSTTDMPDPNALVYKLNNETLAKESESQKLGGAVRDLFRVSLKHNIINGTDVVFKGNSYDPKLEGKESNIVVQEKKNDACGEALVGLIEAIGKANNVAFKIDDELKNTLKKAGSGNPNEIGKAITDMFDKATTENDDNKIQAKKMLLLLGNQSVLNNIANVEMQMAKDQIKDETYSPTNTASPEKSYTLSINNKDKAIPYSLSIAHIITLKKKMPTEIKAICSVKMNAQIELNENLKVQSVSTKPVEAKT